MTPIDPPKKPHWISTALSIIMTLLFLGLVGLYITATVQGLLGQDQLFDLDWGFVLIGMLALTAECVRLTQQELSGESGKYSPVVALAVIAMGLFNVASDTALKVVFGLLFGLAAVLAVLGWLKEQKKI